MQPTERLKGISPFVCAAESGSFTRAAERLNLTSSAVSKSVARLEERLGVMLFSRTTRRLALTDAGEAFYETCSRVLRELEEAEDVLAAQRQTPIGRLRIDLPASFGRLVVMPALMAFFHQHPYLRPHITFTDRFVDPIEEGIDVAVRIGSGDRWPAAIGHYLLGHERKIFCAAPDYLARRGTPLLLPELMRHDAVLYGRADGALSHWRLAQGSGEMLDAAVPRMVVGDGQAHLAALSAGLGIGQVATWLVQQQLDHGALVQILPGYETRGLPLWLIWPRTKRLTPRVDALIHYLQQHLKID